VVSTGLAGDIWRIGKRIGAGHSFNPGDQEAPRCAHHIRCLCFRERIAADFA
jgi:hypothetical protein